MSVLLDPLPHVDHVCYGDVLLIECPEGVFEGSSVTKLAHMLQQLHPKLTHTNKQSLLLELVQTLKNDNVEYADMLLKLLNRRQPRDFAHLNEPAYEAFVVLAHIGLPASTDQIFVSTATANSGGLQAVECAFKILGIRRSIKTSGTVDEDGMTGVSHIQSKNHANVRFNSKCPRADWSGMCLHMANQFIDMGGQFDVMYHWACISQHFDTNTDGTKVSSWTLHEDWSLLITMAMMIDALHRLKPGGTLVLKVRLFDQAETLGLVALMGRAFDGESQIFANHRQTCHFAVVHFTKFRGPEDDTVRAVRQAINRCTGYSPSAIFYNDVCVEYAVQMKHDMLKYEEVRRHIRYAHAVRTTVFLGCLAHVNHAVGELPQVAEWDSLRSLCVRYYGSESGEFIDCIVTQSRAVLAQLQDQPALMAVWKNVMREGSWVQNNIGLKPELHHHTRRDHSNHSSTHTNAQHVTRDK